MWTMRQVPSNQTTVMTFQTLTASSDHTPSILCSMAQCYQIAHTTSSLVYVYNIIQCVTEYYCEFCESAKSIYSFCVCVCWLQKLHYFRKYFVTKVVMVLCTVIKGKFQYDIKVRFINVTNKMVVNFSFCSINVSRPI